MANTTPGPRLSSLAPTAALAAPRIRCGVCQNDDWHREVNKALGRGLTHGAIFTMLGGKGGKGPSAYLIRKHHIHTLEQRGLQYEGGMMPDGARGLIAQRKAMVENQRKYDKAKDAKERREEGREVLIVDKPEDATDDDLAQLIVDTAARGVREGKLGVTVKDGLAAQAILERRAERSEGASLMLKLARLLSGAPMDAIEGTFQEIKQVGPGEDLAAEIVPDETFFDPHMPMTKKFGRPKTKIIIEEQLPPWRKGIDLKARKREREAAASAE